MGAQQAGESQTVRWARLAVDVRSGLRRGAWYPVLSAGPEETVIVVNHHTVILPHDCLEIVNTRPSRWSVVARASGAPYAVCPTCADRVPLNHLPVQLQCLRCNQTFDVEPADALVGGDAHPNVSRRW